MATPEIRKTYKMFIGGQFVRTESGRAFQTADGAVNVPRGSRKDVRDAVVKARGAFEGWAGRTAYNRGQIIYRLAEMLDARRAEFMSLLDGTRGARRREIDDAVSALVWYAGWCDKLHAVTGTVNPVAGPYFSFTLPEPTGVVGVVAPDAPALSGLVHRIAPAICSGNTVVALASEAAPLPALVFGEILATGDVPGGVVNIISGTLRELVEWLAGHMDVNAIDISGCDEAMTAAAQRAAATNVKRVVRGASERSLESIVGLLEMKTVWHPIGR